MFAGGLSEKDQDSVQLHEISPQILEVLIGFIYSGKVNINQNNVQELLVASDMLGLNEVVSGCSEFLIKEMHPINAIGIYRWVICLLDQRRSSLGLLSLYESFLQTN